MAISQDLREKPHKQFVPLSIFLVHLPALVHISMGLPADHKAPCDFFAACYTKSFSQTLDISDAMNFADKMPSPHRLLIVGAGLTGSVTASLLRRKFPKDVLNITVWEKSRGAGGRMTTNRNPSDPRCTADLGAQYVSATSAYAKSHERQVAYHNLMLLRALTSL